MKKINEGLASTDFFNKPNRFWQLSGEKIILVEKDYDETKAYQYLPLKVNMLCVPLQNGYRVFNIVPILYSLILPEKKN